MLSQMHTAAQFAISIWAKVHNEMLRNADDISCDGIENLTSHIKKPTE